MLGILKIILTRPAGTTQGEGMLVTIEQKKHSMMSGIDHGAGTELIVADRKNLVVTKEINGVDDTDLLRVAAGLGQDLDRDLDQLDAVP
jgi:hypothetical protein